MGDLEVASFVKGGVGNPPLSPFFKGGKVEWLFKKGDLGGLEILRSLLLRLWLRASAHSDAVLSGVKE